MSSSMVLEVTGEYYTKVYYKYSSFYLKARLGVANSLNLGLNVK